MNIYRAPDLDWVREGFPEEVANEQALTGPRGGKHVGKRGNGMCKGPMAGMW